jgi:hypothetical protein
VAARSISAVNPRRGPWPFSRERTLAGLALAGLVVLLLPRALLRGEAFYDRDLMFDWITQVEGLVRSARLGSWPLWDNSKSFGQPLLANPDAQVLYPFTWLHLVMDPLTYYTVFAAGHLLLAGAGAAALARALGASRLAALAAGALFLASGPMLSLVDLWHHFASAAWMPWVCLGAVATADSARLRAAIAWGLALSAQILAGSADMCALGLVLAAVLFLRRASWRAPLSAGNRRLAGLALTAGALALGLTAAQWLPTLEQARRSLRMSMPDSMRTGWSVAPASLVQMVAPSLRADVTLDHAAGAAAWLAGDGFLRSLYLGLPALALAAAALAGPAGGRRLALAAAAAGAILYALGPATPVHAVVNTLLPPLRVFRYPSKAMVPAALGLCVLAGLGVDAWARLPPRRRWVAVVAPVALGTVLLLLPAAVAPAPARRSLLLGAGAGALALAFAIAGRGAAAVAGLALGAAVLAGRDVNLTAPRALLRLRPPVLDAIAPLPPGAGGHLPGGPRLYVFEYLRDPARSRRYLGRDEPYPMRLPPGMGPREAQVLAQRLYPFPPSAGRWGFEGSFDPNFQGLYPWYLADLSSAVVQAEGTPLHHWLLRLGAVGHVVALHTEGLEALRPVAALPTLFPEPARAFAVPRPLARAFLVSGARPGADVGALRGAAADLDPEREALLADLPARVAPDPGFTGAVRHFEVRPDRVRAEVEANVPAWLVMVDAFDPGWRARVDGVPAPLLRANVAFRAVAVPAGRHRVELTYRPSGVGAGLAISGLAALALAGLAWRARGRSAPGVEAEVAR